MAIEPAITPPQASDVELATAFHAKHQELVKEIHSVVVGQDRIIRELLTALFALSLIHI